ncbi:hypothetical protein DNC80_15485 [Flavobacterium sp. SOK18b]|uniref:hypothetical protein n=1 Tax=Flavobacterium sp. SOK18b TaxID=797900 RepID=UPI0015F9AFF7|nr:hypothetical protein [Flavobacterium sp. SOK18b]MBB1195067.1 hypothetical protein [Flavobacterium sp. SOK18b]
MKKVLENIKAIIALFIVFFSFSYFFITTFFGKENPQILIAVVGALSLVIGYYFGSSSGSAQKQETIDKMNQNKTT